MTQEQTAPLRSEADDILDEVFPAEAKCQKCGGELNLFEKDGIRLGTCKSCNTPYVNIQPKSGGGFGRTVGIHEFKKFPRF